VLGGGSRRGVSTLLEIPSPNTYPHTQLVKPPQRWIFYIISSGVISATLCLNADNVAVPLQPCAAHSANNMDERWNHQWMGRSAFQGHRRINATTDSHQLNQRMLCNTEAKVSKTSKRITIIVMRIAWNTGARGARGSVGAVLLA